MGRLLKVAHVTTTYLGKIDGLEAKLARLDSYDDIEITVFTAFPEKDKSYPVSSVRQICYNIDRSIKPLHDIKSILELYKLFKNERFDIVHTHTAKAGVAGAIAARLAKVPNIFHTSHGLPFYEGQSKISYFKYKFIERFACLFRDHYFSQNRRDLNSCAELMGSTDKVSFEGNGVDIESVIAEAQKNVVQAKKLFAPADFKLVMTARLESVKRVNDFITICRMLCDSGKNISAVIAGEGAFKEELSRQIKDYGLRNRINLCGWVPFAPSLILASDVLVLTSEKEGIPRSAMEAMVLEKPVVATDVLGTQELVVDSETGFLSKLGDLDHMVNNISRLINDRQLGRILGGKGRERIGRCFNDLNIADNIREFYLKATRLY